MLTGKVALVAGSTRGAGRGTAVALGEAGATVYCTGRTTRTQRSEYDRPETIEETAELVDAAGGTGIAVAVDHLELVMNGESREIPLAGERRSADTTVTVPVERSGWILLRARSDRALYPVLDLYRGLRARWSDGTRVVDVGSGYGATGSTRTPGRRSRTPSSPPTSAWPWASPAPTSARKRPT